ncbi:MAG: hypothetical protein KZQ86_16445 [Candidatus Thiodiazotropha sp. (ex Lucinoma kastoroae)]|nr:hypothetical protein [Candidatus Thiodiazotropha sp. (ex Lucinoma kastoroae)]
MSRPAGDRPAWWLVWNRMWSKCGRIFDGSSGMQARFRAIEWLSGGSLAANYWWTWVKRVFILPILRKTIDVQYFIWSIDNIGTLAGEALLSAAERGVKVRVIVDDLMMMLSQRQCCH